MVSNEQRSTARRSPRPSSAAAWLARSTALAAVASYAVALGLSAAPGAAASTGGKTMSACPKQAKAALPLSAQATKKAAQAALAAAPERYKDLNVNGATVVWSKVATAAGARGGEVAFQCGKTIQARTVVVELRFPKERLSGFS
ncbi:MAG: hypothetical protein ACLP1Q_14445 [Solirubrobacteraceae bacterium]